MELWMKAVLGGLALGLAAVTVFLALQLTRETAVFTYPHPEITVRQVEFRCFEAHQGRAAQENADLSYAAYLERIQRGRGGPQPSVEEFSARAAEALQTADRFLERVESDYGCMLEFVDN